MKILILLGILRTHLLRLGEWEGVCLVRTGDQDRVCKGPGFLRVSFCGVCGQEEVGLCTWCLGHHSHKWVLLPFTCSG